MSGEKKVFPFMLGLIAIVAGGYALSLAPTVFTLGFPAARFLSVLSVISGIALIGCGLGIIGLVLGWIRRGR